MPWNSAHKPVEAHDARGSLDKEKGVDCAPLRQETSRPLPIWYRTSPDTFSYSILHSIIENGMAASFLFLRASGHGFLPNPLGLRRLVLTRMDIA